MGSGIYKLTNKINGKIYIGLAKDIDKRLRGHKFSKKSNCIISKAIQKNGWENFTSEILELVPDLSLLEERETFYIDKFNSTDRNIGYNILRKNLIKYSSDLPIELREKQSKSAKKRYENDPKLGRKLTKGIRDKFLPTIVKKVRQIDRNTGEVLKIWDSMQQASNNLHITRETISRCANRRIIKDRFRRDYILPSAGGFKWELA